MTTVIPTTDRHETSLPTSLTPRSNRSNWTVSRPSWAALTGRKEGRAERCSPGQPVSEQQTHLVLISKRWWVDLDSVRPLAARYRGRRWQRWCPPKTSHRQQYIIWHFWRLHTFLRYLILPHSHSFIHCGRLSVWEFATAGNHWPFLYGRISRIFMTIFGLNCSSVFVLFCSFHLFLLFRVID